MESRPSSHPPVHARPLPQRSSTPSTSFFLGPNAPGTLKLTVSDSKCTWVHRLRTRVGTRPPTSTASRKTPSSLLYLVRDTAHPLPPRCGGSLLTSWRALSSHRGFGPFTSRRLPLHDGDAKCPPLILRLCVICLRSNTAFPTAGPTVSPFSLINVYAFPLVWYSVGLT